MPEACEVLPMRVLGSANSVRRRRPQLQDGWDVSASGCGDACRLRNHADRTVKVRNSVSCNSDCSKARVATMTEKPKIIIVRKSSEEIKHAIEQLFQELLEKGTLIFDWQQEGLFLRLLAEKGKELAEMGVEVEIIYPDGSKKRHPIKSVKAAIETVGLDLFVTG